MKELEIILKKVEAEMAIFPSPEQEVRIYAAICALDQCKDKQQEEIRQLKEILKACVAQILRTGDSLNCIQTEGNDLTLRAMDFLVKGV